MARVLKGSHSFTCTPRVHPLTEWTIPAFAFPAEVGTHLPTPEGWKAESALGGWLVAYRKIDVRHRELNLDTVTRLSTNRARRWLTSLIEANALTTTPDHQPSNKDVAHIPHAFHRTDLILRCYRTARDGVLANHRWLSYKPSYQAARVVSGAKTFDHITPLPRHLHCHHWLLVRHRESSTSWLWQFISAYTRISADILGWRLSGNLCYCR